MMDVWSSRLVVFLFLNVLLPNLANSRSWAQTADSNRVGGDHPVMQLDFTYPTMDKPQSKVWYMDGSWWALLPKSSGPSLWQRLAEGTWKEHPEVAQQLRGVPGRADVFPGTSELTAVGVSERSLKVFHIAYDKTANGRSWSCRVIAELHPPTQNQVIETATLAKDSRGAWWVAAVVGGQVVVWSAASDHGAWSSPYILAKGIDPDDICTITCIADKSIGVIWSDQITQAVVMRRHLDGSPAGEWQKEDVIDKGNSTADDHLNAALASDGTLWVASKNSVDKPGKAQFVLRVRSKEGQWSNWPYVILEEGKKPSRPIVTTVGDSKLVFTGYGDNDRKVPYPYQATIVFGVVDLSKPEVMTRPRVVIAPDPDYRSMIQNVTGPKAPFPPDAPWIVLASDPEGRVYEADLRKLMKTN